MNFDQFDRYQADDSQRLQRRDGLLFFIGIAFLAGVLLYIGLFAR